MSKTRLLTSTLLTMLLLPFGYVVAQEEESTVVDDPVIYESQDYEYDYDYEYTWDDTSAEDLMYTTGEIDPEAGLLGAGMVAFLGTYMYVVFAMTAAVYVFSGLALSKIGKEMGYENPWFAWVPVLNSIMMLQLGGQNPWLLLLALIPGIGAIVVAIISIIALANITEKRGYEKLLVLLVLVPFGMFILLYLLAWKPKTVAQTSTQVEATV